MSVTASGYVAYGLTSGSAVQSLTTPGLAVTACCMADMCPAQNTWSFPVAGSSHSAGAPWASSCNGFEPILNGPIHDRVAESHSATYGS